MRQMHHNCCRLCVNKNSLIKQLYRRKSKLSADSNRTPRHDQELSVGKERAPDTKTASVRDLLMNSTGTTAVEYALIVGAVAVMIIVPVRLIGSSLRGTFNAVESE